MELIKTIFGSTFIYLELDGTFTVDNPIETKTGFISYEDAYKYCISF